MEGKLNSLQVGRGFAALAVLLYHTNEALKRPNYIGRDIFPIFNAGDSGVEYFFVLSGFVILLTHHNDIGRRESVFNFVWKRFTRIYPPLWYIIFIMTFILIAFHPLVKIPERLPSIIVTDLFALPSPRDSIVPVEWTLRHEVIFYTICAVIIINRGYGYFVLAAFFLVPLVMPTAGWNYALSFVFSRYNILFALGGLAAAIYMARFRRWPLQTFLVGILLFGATWASVCHGMINKGDPFAISLYGVGAALILLGAANLERMHAVRFPRFALFLGEASYSVYLVHIPAMLAASAFFAPFARRADLPDSLAFVATASCALGAGIAFHLLVERPSIALSRRARVPAVRSRSSAERRI